VATPPYGIYSTDINHSGELTPQDVLRVIDLLVGAGRYIERRGVSLPEQSCYGDCTHIGGSGGADVNQAFVDMLVELLRTLGLNTHEQVVNFEIYIEWIKDWCVDYVDPDAQDYLVERLTDPDLRFESEEAEEAAYEIVQLLGP
jgi:hypothetical protein